ncbi:hypothetical protein [Microcystis aeruginosa]|uniref:hypothetical protein n=1 Tax=Microcystis aeruginosa TaxID=1126 RepID=UPI0011148CDD|nr:hypothetical protein [Microcystis aeruginosa]
MCDNFCLWNREMLTEKDFYDYFAEETISIGFVCTQKPEEPISYLENFPNIFLRIFFHTIDFHRELHHRLHPF